jgi:hypothetical protein
MAVRIEDAGFEIRDMIAWVYSTGFPKSHNFGCKCSRDALPYSHEENLPREPKAECDLHFVQHSNVLSSMGSSQGRGEVLQPSLQEQGASIKRREQLSAAKVRGSESSMEGRCNLLEKEGQLQANQIRQVSGRVPTDGEEGRIHHGASLDNGADGWKVLDTDRSGASCKSQPAGQQAGESGAFPKQRSAQERGVESDKTCPKCGKLIDWQGWGTALKPALEPITVARKPLGKKTVAANVLEHGTGAINVDGCRVGTNGETPKGSGNPVKNADPHAIQPGRSGGNGGNETSPLGRWPANLIHDGSDEVVGLFPDVKTGNIKPHNNAGSSFQTSKTITGSHKGDTGSAARFFYCAKASKKDRESSTHPTMKPTDLMRYLCRLVTQPGGVVLDPFMGSGSTGKAAVLEGFQFIGIEREGEYLDIATRRIADASPLSGLQNILDVSP